MTRTLLFVGLFGVVGVFCRWGLDGLFLRWLPGFPSGILLANFLGSTLAGVVYALGIAKTAVPGPLAIGLLVGLCGGFTTFSAYALQSLLFLEKGEWLRALVYFGGSPVIGLSGAWLGVTVGRLAS
jgi:CrcB protein